MKDLCIDRNSLGKALCIINEYDMTIKSLKCELDSTVACIRTHYDCSAEQGIEYIYNKKLVSAIDDQLVKKLNHLISSIELIEEFICNDEGVDELLANLNQKIADKH